MSLGDFWEKIQPPRVGEQCAILRICSPIIPEFFDLFILSIKNLHFRAFFIHEQPSPITLRSYFGARGLIGDNGIQLFNFAPYNSIVIFSLFYYMNTFRFLKWITHKILQKRMQ